MRVCNTVYNIQYVYSLHSLSRQLLGIPPRPLAPGPWPLAPWFLVEFGIWKLKVHLPPIQWCCPPPLLSQHFWGNVLGRSAKRAEPVGKHCRQAEIDQAYVAYSTVQYGTVQYSTVQYSTMLMLMLMSENFVMSLREFLPLKLARSLALLLATVS